MTDKSHDGTPRSGIGMSFADARRILLTPPGNYPQATVDRAIDTLRDSDSAEDKFILREFGARHD